MTGRQPLSRGENSGVENSGVENSGVENSGRAAQRRRTRAAIVAAARRLMAGGGSPSVDDVAAEADVSRRTVYMYFPTLDQLLLDAALGALSEAEVAPVSRHETAGGRVDALVRATAKMAPTTLPLGRRILALSSGEEAPSDGSSAAGSRTPRRGYRRTEWIESALEPLQDRLTREQRDRLASALTVLIGWEALIALRDIRGLAPRREEEVLRWAAGALVAAMEQEATNARPQRASARRAGR